MKKLFSILIIFTCLLAFSSAQEEVASEDETTTTETTTTSSEKNDDFYSKRGVYIFPEVGEIAIGVNAAPIFQYLGSFFSNVVNNPGFNYPNQGAQWYNANSVSAKYVVTENIAARARLGIMSQTDKNEYVVDKSSNNPDFKAPEYVTDVVKTSQSMGSFALGAQMYRGKGRLKGIFGAELIMGWMSNKTEYEYGNPITQDFNAPETFNNATAYNNGERLLLNDNGTDMYFGARPFIGVEYFFAPKMAISGEFGYVIYTESTDNIVQEYEYFNSTNTTVDKVEREFTDAGGLGGNLFNSNFDNLGGNINLILYF